MELPKYKIGDKVYSAWAHWKNTEQQCPDCLGQKTWEVTTPAGEKFPLECRTCWQGFDGCSGAIGTWDYEPVVEPRTIGSVRFDSNDENPCQYMAEETGIGSGSVYYQKNLFVTREEAEKQADKLVEEYKAAKIEEFMRIQERKKKDVPHKPYKQQKIDDLERELKQLKIRGY